MGVWLISKGRIVGLRDGPDGPLRSIGPVEAVWFENLEPTYALRNDLDVTVIDHPPPGRLEKLIPKGRKDKAP